MFISFAVRNFCICEPCSLIKQVQLREWCCFCLWLSKLSLCFHFYLGGDNSDKLKLLFKLSCALFACILLCFATCTVLDACDCSLLHSESNSFFFYCRHIASEEELQNLYVQFCFLGFLVWRNKMCPVCLVSLSSSLSYSSFVCSNNAAFVCT